MKKIWEMKNGKYGKYKEFNTSLNFRCDSCVDVLFTRPSAACPECNTPLRRSDFRLQQFEDLIVEKEVDIRKRIVRMYVKNMTIVY